MPLILSIYSVSWKT